MLQVLFIPTTLQIMHGRLVAGQSPAILSNGTTPSLASGITAAEIRTLIDASADPVDLSSVAQNIIPDADSYSET